MGKRICKMQKVLIATFCISLMLSLCTFVYATENEQVDQEPTVLENEEEILDKTEEMKEGKNEEKNDIEETEEVKEKNKEKKDIGEAKKDNKMIQKKSSNITLSDTDIKIDVNHFPDETFRTYLLTSCDLDNDEILSENEIEKITEIDVTDSSYENISDLTGIEYFTSLEWLECSGTSIRKLDLTRVPSLRIVECNECSSLIEIDVTNCKNLEQLECEDTQISEVDVTTCPKLEFLNCSSTNLSSIDVRKNKNLIALYLNETPITSIDVSQNMELTYLECTRSKVISIDVSNHKKLETLYCDLSNVTNVNVNNCSNLDSLLVGYTKIKALDITTCPQLVQLYCTGTAIKEIDVSHNPNLYDLELNGTNITSLDISHNSELSLLWCQGTKLSTLDVTHNPELESLHCYNTSLYSLDVGNNSKVRVIKGDSTIDIGEIEETFNIMDKFPDIDISKVKIVSGATVDSNTGIVSHYKEGVPIVYAYNSGDVKEYYTNTKIGGVVDEDELNESSYQHGSMSLKVTLTFTLKHKGNQSEDKPEVGDKPNTEDTSGLGNNPSVKEEGKSRTENIADTGDILYLELWAMSFTISALIFILLKRKRS